MANNGKKHSNDSQFIITLGAFIFQYHTGVNGCRTVVSIPQTVQMNFMVNIHYLANVWEIQSIVSANPIFDTLVMSSNLTCIDVMKIGDMGEPH